MRCPQCQFENIPGQDRCLRCKAVLQASAAAVIIYPPRMARWKKPIRKAIRWMHLHRILPEYPKPRLPKISISFEIMSKETFAGLIFSIIPGLGHLRSGRFREVRWFVLGWFLTLLGGIFFYGGAVGFSLLAITVTLHIWIAYNHALIKEQTELPKKIFGFSVLTVVLILLYWGIRSTVLRDFDFRFSNLTIPAQNVKEGDLLLARQSRITADVLPRGSLVLGGFSRLYGNNIGANKYEMIGQVIALPGEMAEITGDRFVIDGTALEAEKFPVPKWMSGRRLSVTIPTDCYFVSADYKVYGYGMNLTPDMIRNACILKHSDVKAVAVMRWLPLTRRGFLRTDQ